MASIKGPGVSKGWKVITYQNTSVVKGRLCVIRKSEEAIKLAQGKIIKEASKKHRETKPETLEYAKYIIFIHNLPGRRVFDCRDIGMVSNPVADRTGVQAV